MASYYTISAFSTSTMNTSSSTDIWEYRFPYLSHANCQRFNTHTTEKEREEMQQITDEEFDAAFKDLLFGS